MDKKNIDEVISNLFDKIDQGQSSNFKPTRKIAIIATPRSGSTYFCDMLSQTKVLGEPLEWFHNKFFFAYGKKFGHNTISLKEYINYIFKKSTNESGIFSVKILVDQYLFFLNKKKFDLLSLNFDDIIFISRHDKVAQAYSLAKAMSGGQWMSFIQGSSKVNPDNIKNSDVLRHLYSIALWEEFIESHMAKKISLKYIYEDFTRQKDFPFNVLKDLKLNASLLKDFNSKLEKQTTQHDLLRIEQFRQSINLN
jgi:LPS sulfotransferase NodH